MLTYRQKHALRKIKFNEKLAFENRKITPGPQANIILVMKKFKSLLHKKMAKLEKAYDAANGQPVRQARINRSAASLMKKLKKLEGKNVLYQS